MIINATNTTKIKLNPLILSAGVLLVSLGGSMDVSSAQEPAAGKSFVENFDRIDKKRWFVSDGWSNGDHQNCNWSKEQVKVSDGTLRLSFIKQKAKDREYVCGEVQTNQRFGYGAYEIRMKAAAGSGLNTGFFTYIGPVHKQPHDALEVVMDLGSFRPQARVWQYRLAAPENDNLVFTSLDLDPNRLSVTLPPYSLTLLVFLPQPP